MLMFIWQKIVSRKQTNSSKAPRRTEAEFLMSPKFYQQLSALCLFVLVLRGFKWLNTTQPYADASFKSKNHNFGARTH